MSPLERPTIDVLAGRVVDAAHAKLSQALASASRRDPNTALAFRNEIWAAVAELTTKLADVHASGVEDVSARDAASAIGERVASFISSRMLSRPPSVPVSLALRLREQLLAHTLAAVPTALAQAVLRAKAAEDARSSGMELEFDCLVGTGALGEVWRATDRVNRVLAVKFFHPVDVPERELEQARALARVDHPRVQRLLAVERQRHPDTGELRVAMVALFVEGQPLSMIAQIPAHFVPQIGHDIIDGLVAIHDAGLLHGDLHDGNVIVNGNRATVIDVFFTHSLAKVDRAYAEHTVQQDLQSLATVLGGLVTKAQPHLAAEIPTDAGNARSFRELWEAHFGSTERRGS